MSEPASIPDNDFITGEIIDGSDDLTAFQKVERQTNELNARWVGLTKGFLPFSLKFFCPRNQVFGATNGKWNN